MRARPANVSQLIRDGALFLGDRGVPNARRNAEWLLAHVLDVRSADLYLDAGHAPIAAQIQAYKKLLDRRGAREPLQYILGTTEFMSLEFYSAPGVFIPRPDTEILVQCVENRLADDPVDDGRRIADICCGSGVIAVALARRVARLDASAVDIHAAAVDLAEKNAALNGVADRVHCVHEDAIAYLSRTSERFDAIVCNPPYVRSADIPRLSPEIRDHEPVIGLNGGPEGLDFYCAIAGVLRRSLKPRGFVAFEIGCDQAARVADILEAESLSDVEIHKDYAGHDRVVMARS